MNNVVKGLFLIKALNIHKLILHFYNELALTADELRILLKLFDLLNENNNGLSIKELADATLLNQEIVAEVVNALLEKGFLAIEIETTKNKKAKEIYNLDQTFLKVENLLKKNNHSSSFAEEMGLTAIIDFITKELGRNLTSFEVSIVRKWQSENISTGLIKDVLIDSLKKGRLNIQTVDSIINSKSSSKAKDLDLDTKNIIDEFYSSIKK
ncbi:MAG: DnaD domain protein [Erysipelotrichales bacterium]|nr:DnaD domain protein [Erysipelotrichales bacterium]